MQSLTQPPRDGTPVALELSLSWEGHRVRMVGTHERPEWVAKDVCRVLGIHNSRDALRDIVPDAEKGVAFSDTLGGRQEVATVKEGGLYRLMSRSRKPSAARFQAWLFGEVIPSIRKHGCYPAPVGPALPASVDLRNAKHLAVLMLQLGEIVAEKNAVIAVLAPKAEVYDDCMSSADLLTVAQVANILARPGRPLGEVRLFRFLRAKGVLQNDNRPFQGQIDAGRFVVRETPWTKGDGIQRIQVQPLVSQAGVEYVRRQLDAMSGQLSILPARPARVDR